jgi:hypothetical protein
MWLQVPGSRANQQLQKLSVSLGMFAAVGTSTCSHVHLILRFVGLITSFVHNCALHHPLFGWHSIPYHTMAYHTMACGILHPAFSGHSLTLSCLASRAQLQQNFL